MVIKDIDSKDILTPDEVAEILKVSKQTILEYIHRLDNPLPAQQLSPQVIRILKIELIDWLRSQDDPREDI